MDCFGVAVSGGGCTCIFVCRVLWGGFMLTRLSGGTPVVNSTQREA